MNIRKGLITPLAFSMAVATAGCGEYFESIEQQQAEAEHQKCIDSLGILATMLEIEDSIINAEEIPKDYLNSAEAAHDLQDEINKTSDIHSKYALITGAGYLERAADDLAFGNQNGVFDVDNLAGYRNERDLIVDEYKDICADEYTEIIDK